VRVLGEELSQGFALRAAWVGSDVREERISAPRRLEAQLILTCLSALDGPEWLVAAEALSALCRSRRLLRAAELLEEWVERRIGG